MKKRVVMILVFPILGVLLGLLVYAYFPPVYVLSMGSTTKSVLCSTFSYEPTVNTVHCGNATYSGVMDVRVR